MTENSQNVENTESVEGKTANAEAAAPQTEKSPEVLLTEKLAHAEDKYKYLYADFENFKKRAIKERQDAMKFGWENVAGELLQVLDNFDRALQYAKPETDPNLISGLKMVSQQFISTLGKQGVAEIPTMGQAFNPELHEAVGQMPSDQPAGTIIQEHQKGFTLHGRLLRASRVMLSSGPAVGQNA
jgi:molecular chaperone GrpE